MQKLTFALVIVLISSTLMGQQKELTKKQTIQFIQTYYSNLKTGSYEYDSYESYPPKKKVKKYRQFSGNYKVKVKGSQFQLTFDELAYPNDCTTVIDYDIYNWSNPKMKRKQTIEFNLKDIDSIGKGYIELCTSGVVNWNIKINSKKSIKTTVFPPINENPSESKQNWVNLNINPEENDDIDFYTIKIVKAFKQLIDLCKKY
jgi:hypothetical protein